MGKTAIYGGSFNPIHLGHLRLLSTCMQKLQIDKALLIPANLPPHKETHDLAENHHRLAMCRLAVSDIPGITVSDIEMTREGKSYTVYTMRKLRERYPQEKFYFIMGTDMFLSFDRWYEWKEILTYCDLCVSVRAENEFEALLAKKEALCRENPTLRTDFAHLVQSQSIEISSTAIRNMIKEGDPLAEKYLPQAVSAYMKENQLYV